MKGRGKFFINIISVLMAAIVLGTFMTSCANDAGEKDADNGVITSTDIDLVKGGKSDYVVVVSDDATNYETYAAEELVLYLEESTNCRLNIVTDSGKTFNQNDKVISIGRTDILSESGVEVSYDELKRDGFVIKRLGNTLILCGGGGYGTLYAVYEFLYRQIEWEAYAVDEIYYVRTQNLKVLDFDFSDKPAIEYRQGGYWASNNDPYFAAKWRCHGGISDMLFAESCWYFFPHAIFQMVPPTEYAQDHPDWYSYSSSGNAQQPCFTNEEFEAQLVSNLKEIIVENPSVTFFPFGLEDTNGTMCKCDKCRAEMETYGATGLVVRWVNRVVEKIMEWKNERLPDREVYFPFLAYYDTMSPPVNSQGEPIDRTVILNEYSPVLYANIFADNDIPYTDSLHNGSTYAAIQGWGKCSSTYMFYFYTNSFSRKFEWVDTVYTHTQNYILAAELKAMAVEDDASNGDFQGNALQTMYSYIYAKLQWNPYADTNELINKYMTHYYREAADDMLDYYYLFKMQVERTLDEYEENGGYYSFVGDMEDEYLNKGVLEQCLGYLKAGVEKINNAEHYTTSEKQAIIQRIEIEMLTPLVYLLDYCDAEYTAKGYLALVDETEALIYKYGMSYIYSSKTNEETFAEWRARKNG